MKAKKWMFVLSALLLLGLLTSFSPAQEDALPYAPGQLLVKFKAAATAAKKKAILKRRGGREVQSLAGINVSIVAIGNVSPTDAAQSMAQESLVEYAEPNYVYHAVDHNNGDYTVNDPRWSEQYGPKKIEAPGAWQMLFNKKGSNPDADTALVNIAICDTGVDPDHEDLQGKLVANEDFTGGGNPTDFYGHGTHVAGIAAAVTNNAKGIAGVGFSAKIMNVKVLDDYGSGYTSWIASGIRWAADNGADVINLSLGGGASSTTMKSAVDYAWSKGVVVVAAAGNSSSSSRFYPAAYENCIAVAATDANDKRAWFSNFGDWVDCAAPGVDVLSTVPHHDNVIGLKDYGSLSGTSMSAPHVAGVAALVFAYFADDGITNTLVRSRIENGADPLSGVTGIGKGRVNAHKAVSQQAPPPPPPPQPTLNVKVTTNKATYKFNEFIWITVTVTDGTKAVGGATVTLTVTNPNGGSSSTTGKTNSQGKYIVLGFASKSDGAGTYTASATASKTGYTSGSGSTTFAVR